MAVVSVTVNVLPLFHEQAVIQLYLYRITHADVYRYPLPQHNTRVEPSSPREKPVRDVSLVHCCTSMRLCNSRVNHADGYQPLVPPKYERHSLRKKVACAVYLIIFREAELMRLV